MKTVINICCGIFVAGLVLDTSINIWIRMFLLILLLVYVWLDAAVRESQKCVDILKEINKKCRTLPKN